MDLFPDELITLPAVSALTGLCRHRLSPLIRLNLFPWPASASNRRWNKQEVLEWVRLQSENS